MNCADHFEDKVAGKGIGSCGENGGGAAVGVGFVKGFRFGGRGASWGSHH